MFKVLLLGSLLVTIARSAIPKKRHTVRVDGEEVELRRPPRKDHVEDAVKPSGDKKSKKKSWWKRLPKIKRNSEGSLNPKRSSINPQGHSHSEGSKVFRVIGTWGEASLMKAKRRSSFSNMLNRLSNGYAPSRRLSEDYRRKSILTSILFKKKKKNAGVTDLDVTNDFGMWPTDSDNVPSSPISPRTLTTNEFIEKSVDAYEKAFLAGSPAWPTVDSLAAAIQVSSPVGKSDEIEDVFCNYEVMKPDALCLSKVRGSDFTNIFVHDFMTKETETCQTFTFTPLKQLDKKVKGFKKEEIVRAWENALANVDEARWQDTAVQADLVKFTHVIIGDCKIHFSEFIDPQVSALVVQPEEEGKLVLAFFTVPEEPQLGVEFTMISPEKQGNSGACYYSYEPYFTLTVTRVGFSPKAQLRVNNEIVFSVRLSMFGDARPYIITKRSSNTSEGQLFFFYDKTKTDDLLVMVKYQGQWAILHHHDPKVEFVTGL